MAQATSSPDIAKLDGPTLLGERAALNRFTIPGLTSAGGGCRLYPVRDGMVALNLSRPDDHDLLPALFGDAALDVTNDAARQSAFAQADWHSIVDLGRTLGLAIATVDETANSPAIEWVCEGPPHSAHPKSAPLVVDLSAIWAGPLCGHLLHLAGAQVVKVENPNRPDSMRAGDPELFALLHQGKANVALDPRNSQQRDQLIALLKRADIVIEASRPRALQQLGIDAKAILEAHPGQIWITVTGHGMQGSAAEWIGFGDDCGVAGGLTSALLEASGSAGFVGDAIADPLTGIFAATQAWNMWQQGRSGRAAISMSGVVATALAEERRTDAGLLQTELQSWTTSIGTPFPPVRRRNPTTPVRALGADTQACLEQWTC